MRTTAGPSHLQGLDPRCPGSNQAGPRANNHRLVACEKVGPMRAMCEHRVFALIGPKGALCEQPPFIRLCKGRTQGSKRRFSQARPRGPCANNRWLLAHEDSQPLAFCTCKGRTYARYVRTAVGYSDMQGAGPKVIGTCKGPIQESNSQLFGCTLLGATWSPDGKGPCSNNRSGRTEGAMCEQPPVIRMRQGRTHGGHVRTTTGYMQRSDARGPCVNKAIRIWNSVTCMWSLSSGLQGSMCEQPPAIRT